VDVGPRQHRLELIHFAGLGDAPQLARRRIRRNHQFFRQSHALVPNDDDRYWTTVIRSPGRTNGSGTFPDSMSFNLNFVTIKNPRPSSRPNRASFGLPVTPPAEIIACVSVRPRRYVFSPGNLTSPPT